MSTDFARSLKHKEAQQREMPRLQTERDVKQCEQKVGAQAALPPPLIADA